MVEYINRVWEFFYGLPYLGDIAQIQVFLYTWFFAQIFIYFAIRIANLFKLHDLPNEERKIHTQAVPTIGGLAIFAAFFMGIVLAQEGWDQMKYIMLGAFICMLLGLIDDLKPISAVWKLLVLFLVTSFIYLYSNIAITLTPYVGLNLVISLIWVVGMMSAINSLDNMDGLASGVTAIACFFMFFIAWEHWQRWLSFMSVALFAACFTFLKYNFFRTKAEIFLGDNGSYFIGFILACMAMMGAWTNPAVKASEVHRMAKAFIVPPLLLGVPIFDIVTATILRLINREVSSVKEAIVYCGTDHTSHRLVALGFSRRQAVVIIWVFAICLGIVSLIIQNSKNAYVYIPLTVVTLVALFVFALILNRAKVYKSQFPPDIYVKMEP